MNKHVIDGLCTPLEAMEAGILATNVYFAGDGAGGLIVVDPADDAEGLLEQIDGRPVSAIFVTHGHYDHICALDEVRSATQAPVYAMAEEVDSIEEPRIGYNGRIAPPSTVDHALRDGDVIEVGNTAWQVIHTPGHTPGGCCYLLTEDHAPQQGKPVMFAGDTLFCGTIGRTDLEGGNMADMRASLGKLARLDDDTIVLPGHGALTSIGIEKPRTIEAFR